MLTAVTSPTFPRTGRLAGMMTAGELAAAGFSRSAIQRRAAAGVLIPVRRGVYVPADQVGAVPGSAEFSRRALQIAAAVAASGNRAVAAYHDAALLHGLDLLERASAEPLAVVRPAGKDTLLAGRPAIRVRVAPLAADQVSVRAGVPVTSVARTVVDLARTVPFRSGVVIADSALHTRKATSSELANVLGTCGRWPGMDRARRVVAFADGRSESPFESIARVAFRDGGLPRPELQVWVGGDCGPVGRVDFLWREHGTIAEADGALKYADPDRARQQLRRDADLREAGFEVVHFGWAELTVTPGRVIEAILAAFSRARRPGQPDRDLAARRSA